MAQVDVASSKDINGKIMYVDFASGSKAAQQAQGGSAQLTILDTRFVSRVVNVAGAVPGYTQIHIPMKRFGAGHWDESAPLVALLKGGMGKIKPRIRYQAYYKESGEKVPLQCGYIVKVPHVIGADSGGAVGFDDKWLLSKVTSFGRMCYDPISEQQYFDAGVPCIFNMGGHGDCLDTPNGPRFSPSHRFGYKAKYNTEQTTEPEAGSATARARKWRVGDCLLYMRDNHYIGIDVPRMDYGQRTINNNFIIWPTSLIDAVSSARVVNNLNCENMSLAMALDRIIKKAGPLELFMDCGAGFSSILKVVSMNPSDSSGVSLRLPSYQDVTDVGALLNDAELVQGGYIDESIVDYFDDVCICGDPVAVERELSMNHSGNQLALEAAWDSADETEFKNYITNHSSIPNSKLAFQAACKIWPLVYCAYRLTPGQTIWASTKWEDNVGNLSPYTRFRAYLLSSFNQGESNPRNTLARDVVIEYYDGSNWQAAERYDFFSLSPDGQFFMLPALRDKDDAQTWRNTGSSTYNGATFTKNNIRLTIPIESDWRITGKAGDKDAENDSTNVADPNQTADRIEGGERFTYLAVAEALDYIEHLRYDGHPNGISGVGGISATEDAFPDKASEGNELFTDRKNNKEGRIIEHAKARLRDVKRIQYGGQLMLSSFNPALKPGDPITLAGGNDVISVVTCAKAVIHDASVQGTIVECGAMDKSGIYDMPKSGMRFSDGGLTQQPAAESQVKKSPGYIEDEDEIGGNNRGKYK